MGSCLSIDRSLINDQMDLYTAKHLIPLIDERINKIRAIDQCMANNLIPLIDDRIDKKKAIESSIDRKMFNY